MRWTSALAWGLAWGLVAAVPAGFEPMTLQSPAGSPVLRRAQAPAGTETDLLGPGAERYPESGGFASELDAVSAAANRLNPISVREDREFIGAVVYAAGRYYYTASPGRRGANQVTARLRIPPDAYIIAFWHTHGAPKPDRAFFSEVDTALVRRLARPFYLADHTGVLKVYAPGDPLLSAGQARRLGLPATAGYARGRPVRSRQGFTVRVDTRSWSMRSDGAG